jgi:hypothetical protein
MTSRRAARRCDLKRQRSSRLPPSIACTRVRHRHVATGSVLPQRSLDHGAHPVPWHVAPASCLPPTAAWGSERFSIGGCPMRALHAGVCCGVVQLLKSSLSPPAHCQTHGQCACRPSVSHKQPANSPPFIHRARCTGQGMLCAGVARVLLPHHERQSTDNMCPLSFAHRRLTLQMSLNKSQKALVAQLQSITGARYVKVR